MTAAVAYIRRSHSGEAQASEDTQRDTVQQLAEQRGETIAHVYRDWGRSGGSETRPQYLAMVAAVESGDVKTIYAYDQDRLARSIFMFAGLLRLADIHDLAIITPSGDLADDDRRDFAEMRGVMDGGELRKITKRNRATIAMCRERGDTFGLAPLGHVKQKDSSGRVIEAYRTAGTFLGAARALNEAGVPVAMAERVRADGQPWAGGRFRTATWHATVVRRIIAREAPELVPDTIRQGSRGPSKPRLLAGILRCYCGGMLTPGGSITNRSLDYYCSRGQRDPDHGRPYHISERKLLPWVKAEAAKLRMPYDEVTMPAEGADYDDSAQRAALEGMRGTVADATIDAALADLDAKRIELGERAQLVVEVPPAIDWTWSAEGINEWLRAAFDHIELGADLLPLRSERLVPEWWTD